MAAKNNQPTIVPFVGDLSKDKVSATILTFISNTNKLLCNLSGMGKNLQRSIKTRLMDTWKLQIQSRKSS